MHMKKNITLSVDNRLIEQARRQAAMENRSLNDLFREWLAIYVAKPAASEQYNALMQRLEHVQTDQTYSREEMNDRR